MESQGKAPHAYNLLLITGDMGPSGDSFKTMHKGKERRGEEGGESEGRGGDKRAGEGGEGEGRMLESFCGCRNGSAVKRLETFSDNQQSVPNILTTQLTATCSCSAFWTTWTPCNMCVFSLLHHI